MRRRRSSARSTGKTVGVSIDVAQLAGGRQPLAPGESAVAAALHDDRAGAVALRINGQDRALVGEEHRRRMAEVLARLPVDDDLTMGLVRPVDPTKRRLAVPAPLQPSTASAARAASTRKRLMAVPHWLRRRPRRPSAATLGAPAPSPASAAERRSSGNGTRASQVLQRLPPTQRAQPLLHAPARTAALFPHRARPDRAAPSRSPCE